MSSLIDHYEATVGPIESGWHSDIKGVSIVRIRCSVLHGVMMYATLGLSRHVLALPDGRTIRMELLALSASSFDEACGKRWASVMDQIATGIVHSHNAPLLGNFYGPAGPMFEGKKLEALYVANPMVLPEAFWDSDLEEGAPVFFAWLVPLYAAEAAYRQRHGWSKLEDELERQDLDLFDLDRASLVLPST